MSQWSYVSAAYVVMLVGTAMLLLVSWRALRAAERGPE